MIYAMDKREKILICGKSGAGKDFLLRKLKEKGLNSSIKWTTRPKRNNETNDVEYHFTDDATFLKMKSDNQFAVSEQFSNHKGDVWNYGISNEDFGQAQAFIMTPGEIAQLDEEVRKGCFVVYLDIDRSIRESRLPIREDNNDSIQRRLDADEKDFKKFHSYDLKITDPEFEVDMVWDLMV